MAPTLRDRRGGSRHHRVGRPGRCRRRADSAPATSAGGPCSNQSAARAQPRRSTRGSGGSPGTRANRTAPRGSPGPGGRSGGGRGAGRRVGPRAGCASRRSGRGSGQGRGQCPDLVGETRPAEQTGAGASHERRLGEQRIIGAAHSTCARCPDPHRAQRVPAGIVAVDLGWNGEAVDLTRALARRRARHRRRRADREARRRRHGSRRVLDLHRRRPAHRPGRDDHIGRPAIAAIHARDGGQTGHRGRPRRTFQRDRRDDQRPRHTGF